MTKSITLISLLSALSGCSSDNTFPRPTQDAGVTYTVQSVGELQVRNVSDDVPGDDEIVLEIVDLQGAQITVLD